MVRATSPASAGIPPWRDVPDPDGPSPGAVSVRAIQHRGLVVVFSAGDPVQNAGRRPAHSRGDVRVVHPAPRASPRELRDSMVDPLPRSPSNHSTVFLHGL